MAHFSVKHRSPLRNNFIVSRRQRRHTASRCLANFFSPFSIPSETFCGASESCVALNFLDRAQPRVAVLLKPKNNPPASEGGRYKIARHQTRRRFGGRQPLCGIGVT